MKVWIQNSNVFNKEIELSILNYSNNLLGYKLNFPNRDLSLHYLKWTLFILNQTQKM